MRTSRNSLGRLVTTVAVTGAVTWAAGIAVNRSLVRVQGPSMEPALWPDDVLFTVPAALVGRRRGQVVVVDDPTRPGHRVVKRIRSLDAAGVDVRGDAPTRSTDSRHWGRVRPAAVRRVAVARWPDLRTPLRRTSA